ncbi:major facilitator superfamily domain-containing protein [Desarmillaria tabescens]|uniref:Major facilitator superfamily domain-containing protein n=1 Tax=Armillaria tabescens TaxID=1929756 RepID=A0AA39N8S2_ARMTA|nr:major facilitator superfamily domain-containing protein [Desarmillaria tabescens]KAK0461117.1 major facilitator superfamily domain-containing protein [Desarmillaria tabescens]
MAAAVSSNEKFTVVEKDDVETASANEDAPEIDILANNKLVWKTDLRIVPLSAFIYLLCNIDRSNIGNAKIMNKEEGHDLLAETNLTSYQYTIALTVFFLAYAFFEVPSNILLKRLRPSRWIATLMFIWGVITIGLGGVTNHSTLTIVRFLLGAFEAGLFPGLVYYVTFWYRPEERSLRVALILASATLAGAFGGAIAYGIAHMEGSNGLSAWRWLFILEGIPSAVLAFPIWYLLPDYPETASWLSPEEKALSAVRLKDSSKASGRGLSWRDVTLTLMDWRLWIHFLVYFGISAPFSSMSLFAPTIVSCLGYTSLRAQLMTSVVIFSATFAAIGAVGFIASATLPADAYKVNTYSVLSVHLKLKACLQSRYGMLIIACAGAFSCISPLLGWLSCNMRSTATTGLAVALNISFGAPGQIVGVWIYKSEEASKGYPTGHWTNAALLIFVSAGCIGLHLLYKSRNHIIRENNSQEMLWKL